MPINKNALFVLVTAVLVAIITYLFVENTSLKTNNISAEKFSPSDIKALSTFDAVDSNTRAESAQDDSFKRAENICQKEITTKVKADMKAASDSAVWDPNRKAYVTNDMKYRGYFEDLKGTVSGMIKECLVRNGVSASDAENFAIKTVNEAWPD